MNKNSKEIIDTILEETNPFNLQHLEEIKVDFEVIEPIKKKRDLFELPEIGKQEKGFRYKLLKRLSKW